MNSSGKENSRGQAMWLTLLMFFNLLALTTATAMNYTCPPRTFSPLCAKCTCDWSTSTGCDSKNGQCACKDGFKGLECRVDIDECFYHPSICDNKICKNTIGSYKCVPCPFGFTSYKGSDCEPCPSFTYGDGCNENCQCVQEHTIFCLSASGECICEEGWQGADCGESVDDCVSNNCPEGTCEDRHMHYVCVCGDNFMVIGDSCERFKATFISLERKISVGQWVDLYMFFSLPDKFFKANHQAPVLDVKISDDQSSDSCWVIFKKQSKRVKGDEPVLSEIDDAMRADALMKILIAVIARKGPAVRKKPYHRYIHVVRRFTKQAVTSVIADVPGLKRKWTLVYDVRFKSDVVRNCLENITVPEIAMDDVKKAHLKAKLRQSYYVFEVEFPESDNCFESPRVAWDYYAVNMVEDRNLCLMERAFKKLDTDLLARENGEIPLSDHQQYKEILTKNTLPLGLCMLCVMAYIQRSVSTKVTACGFFTVEPSYKLVGSISPSGNYMTLRLHDQLTITANYRELDIDAKLTYTWKCRFNLTKYTNPAVKKACEEGGYKRNWLRIEQEKDFFYIGLFKMELIVAVEDKPEYFYAKNISFRIVDSLKVTTVYVTCISECEDRVSGKNSVILSADGPDFVSCHWKVYMTPLDGSKDKVVFSRSLSRLNSKEPLQFRITAAFLQQKTKRLPLGQSFLVYADCKHQVRGNIYRAGRGSYQFQTVRAPVGDGCLISPTSGRAVFTRFNVTCVGYKDVETGLPLVYKLYQSSTKNGENIPILVGYSNEGQFSPITLSDDSGVSDVDLRVTITTVFQTSTTFDLSVKLTTEDQKKVIAKTSSDRKAISTLGSQEELRLIKDVSTVMKASASADTKSKTKVRKQLMQNMRDFQAVAGDSIEHSSSALKELSARDDEVDENGLNNGLQVTDRISKYLGKVGGGDFLVVKDVANLQVSAMNSLVKVSSSVGKKRTNVTVEEKERIKKQGKENSKRTIDSMSQITKILRSGFDTDKKPIKMKEDTMEVVLESTNMSDINMVKMQSDNDAVSFSISPRVLNYVGNGNVETEFEFYNKSPYSWTSDRVQGDIPVIKVNFVEPEVEKEANDMKLKRDVWRFSKPADVFLENRDEEITEGTDHSMLILVNKYTNKVYMSSCIYLSVLASTEEVTVLELSSPEDLIFKAKARYTNAISAFVLLTDHDMIDLPLTTPPGLFNTLVEGRNLTRNSNFLILPKLTKKQYKLDTPLYNVKISIKKGQDFKDVQGLGPLPEEALQTVVEENELELDTDALELYNLTVNALYQQLSCVYFDEEKLDYSYDSCELSVFTSKTMLHCRCVVAAAFSASFFVMPRLVDPTNIQVFSQVFENPLTISLVIFLWLTFFTLFIWGRRKDREDEIKRGATILTDNKNNDSYLYLICVVTGNSAIAGTTSNVYMFLNGSWFRSAVYVLKDNARALFTRGAENWFVLTTPYDLGFLKSAVVWTDYSGGHPSWFLYNIHVQNLQTGEAWNLKFNSWLSSSKGSGQIIAEIPAVEENIYKEGWLSKITGKGRVDIRNEHLWFGVVFKTAYNKFTRLRRLATALTMLQTLMLLNLMFYGIRNIDDSRQFTFIFGRRIHLTSVIIGVQCCVIMTVFGMGLAGFFNRIVPRPKKEGGINTDVLTMEEYFEKKRLVATLDALQTYVSHDMYNKRAAKLLAMYRYREKEEEEERPPEKKPQSDMWFTFPWWCIYIYWIFLVVYNVFASYYIMLHGLSLGYEESVNWVVSFFSGFLFDLIISQPIKVMGTVLVLVLIYRQSYTLKDMAPFSNAVDASNAVKKSMERSKSYFSSTAHNEYHRPPTTLKIKEVMARLAMEATAREMLRDLLLYSVFLAALIAMTYSHSNTRKTFMQTTAINKFIYNVDFNEDGEESSVLDDISSVEGIWSFFNDHLLPFLVATSHDKIDLNSFYFLGTARIRQVRVERDESGCDTLPLNLVELYQKEHCALSMYDGKEETRDFNQSWFEPIDYSQVDSNSTEDNDDDEDELTIAAHYHYKTAKELKTASIKGHRATYPGGGYTLTLPRNDIAEGIVIVKRLANSGWMDHLTRCLFVEFTMYNPNSNLFSYVVTGFEFDEMGGPYPFKTVTSSRLYHYSGDEKEWIETTEMIVAICTAFYTVIIGKALLRAGLRDFINDFWNWVDVITVVLLYLLAIFIFMRDSAMYSVLVTFERYGHNRFLDFQAVFRKDFFVAVTEGFVGAAGFLKLIYILRFNPFTTICMKTAEIAKADVFGFTVMAAMFMIGFSLFALIIFGKYMSGYRDLPHCFLSLLFFIMGEAEFPGLIGAHKVLGPIYFMAVMLVTQYIVLNFFLSMMRDGLDMAISLNYGKEEATFGYMMRTLKLYSGIGSNRQIKKGKQK